MPAAILRDHLRRELRKHPRVTHQGLFADPAAVDRLVAEVPTLVPFRGDSYASGMWVVDWDHCLPSKNLILRLYAYYTEESRLRGDKDLAARLEEIARDDLFPEFDVPDLAGLHADEAYEAELPPDGAAKKLRLVSEWRRQVDPKLGRQAEEVVRASTAFAELASQVRGRPPGLGDVEAAEWAPPSESGHSQWGIDVWFLRTFNGMVGEGTAFLVDLQKCEIVSQREFQFRAG